MSLHIKKKSIINFFLITIATLLVTIGVYYFKFPNHLSIGGVTGLGILMSRLLNGAVSSSSIILVVNSVLLVLGYIFFGKGFGIKTTYASLLMSISLRLLESINPITQPLTNQPVLELFFAVTLTGAGAAILFNLGCSTGGTDIVAMLLQRKTNINIGQALLASDTLLTLLTFPLFGTLTGLLSVTGLVLHSIVIDNIMENINLCKYLTVICDYPEPICHYIISDLNRSATIQDANGAFTDQKKKIILTVLNRSQAVYLKKFIKETEPGAFVLITNTSEIIGRGFRGC